MNISNNKLYDNTIQPILTAFFKYKNEVIDAINNYLKTNTIFIIITYPLFLSQAVGIRDTLLWIPFSFPTIFKVQVYLRIEKIYFQRKKGVQSNNDLINIVILLYKMRNG